MKRLLLIALLIVSLCALITVIAPAAHASSPAGNKCAIKYTVNGDFRVGFVASIFITNTSTTTINNWTLQFAFPGNQQITSSFNGVFTQAGQNVTVVNRPWNGTIAPGQTLTGAYPGFVASYSGTNTNPTSFTLNGNICALTK